MLLGQTMALILGSTEPVASITFPVNSAMFNGLLAQGMIFIALTPPWSVL
jgi:hypothetical protein